MALDSPSGPKVLPGGWAKGAEALAEGRGRAQAEALRRTRRDVTAKRLKRPERETPCERVAAAPPIDPVNLVMCYLLAVVVTGLRGGRAPAVLASVVGVLAFDLFSVPPRLSFAMEGAPYVITFAALVAVALTVGSLTGRVRAQAELSRRREASRGQGAHPRPAAAGGVGAGLRGGPPRLRDPSEPV